MIKKIKLAELFFSLQGEGPRTGKPSIFVRSFGCTLRCPAFGLCKKDIIPGMVNTEVQDIIKKHKETPYKSLKDLPLCKTGCDSYPSIYPEFQDLLKDYTVDELKESILKLADGNLEGIDLVVTGGEPLLHQPFWADLIKVLADENGLTDVTFETNGTIPFKPELFEDVIYNEGLDVLLSTSPKLSCSGNKKSDAIRIDVLKTFINDHTSMYFKFVINDKDDVVEVKELLKEFNEAIIDYAWYEPKIYLMPCGGTMDEKFKVTKKEVADICLENRWRFSDRLHLTLYGNKWAT